MGIFVYALPPVATTRRAGGKNPENI